MKMKQELQVIQDLMADLMEKMEYGEEDFAERLGKPKAAAIEIEVGPEMAEGEEMEEEEDEEEGPDAMLKQRLMKMRG